MTYHILYNPHAGNENGLAQAKQLSNILTKDNLDFVNITKIKNYDAFFEKTPLEDKVLLTGGDGTLNRFINDCNTNNALETALSHEIYYYAAGSGNDFLRDVNDNNKKSLSL